MAAPTRLRLGAELTGEERVEQVEHESCGGCLPGLPAASAVDPVCLTEYIALVGH